MYSGGPNLDFMDVIFRSEIVTKKFTGKMEYINTLSDMIKADPELGKSKCFSELYYEYRPEELVDVLRGEKE